MGFKATLISLPIVHLTGDPFGNIPFMPTSVTCLAGYLRQEGVDVSIIDGFGSAPKRMYKIDDKLSAFGLTEDEIVEQLSDEKLVGISVHAAMSHSFALRLAKKIKARNPDVILIAGGHHVSIVYKEFLEGDFDYVCYSEGERPLLGLVEYLRDNKSHPSEIVGLLSDSHTKPVADFEEDLDKLGFAALDMLALENYWKLGMSHAPVQGKYMVITTSRGCPYKCRFCTTPLLQGRKWRTRSPKHIVDEIEQGVQKYGIEDVLIQDEIFAAKKEVALEMAKEIQKRGLKIRLYLPSGTKIETIDEETLSELRKVGLQHICLAPESGSERILKKMNKPMDFEKLERIVVFARKIGIKIMANFVVGFEDENDDDRRLTRELVLRLTKLGVHEVSLFIWTPLPGAASFESETGWERYEDLNWSPRWRSNYGELNRFRKRLYAQWLFTKLLYHPIDLVRSARNVLIGRYELKSEMALRRVLNMYLPFLW